MEPASADFFIFIMEGKLSGIAELVFYESYKDDVLILLRFEELVRVRLTELPGCWQTRSTHPLFPEAVDIGRVGLRL